MRCPDCGDEMEAAKDEQGEEWRRSINEDQMYRYHLCRRCEISVRECRDASAGWLKGKARDS